MDRWTDRQTNKRKEGEKGTKEEERNENILSSF